MNMLKGLIGGLIAGSIGAAIWAAIYFYAGYEIGWIAWGIGGLVGYGVALGGQTGPPAGLAAVVLSVLAILGGKYATVELLLNRELGSPEEMVQETVDKLQQEEVVVSWLADDIIAQREAQGEQIEWPTGVTADEAGAESGYPTAIWSEAATQWEGKSDEDRLAYRTRLADELRQKIEENYGAFRTEMAKQGFMASFGAIDIIFILLAVVTAFKIGSGDGKDDAEAEYEDADETELDHETEQETDSEAERRN